MEMIMRIMNENKRRNEINSIERYELFEEALSHCGKFLLNLADEDIEYHIFEEFDGDCTSFLNEKNLERLRLSSKITLEIVDMALELSSKFRALEGTELWNVSSIRKDEKWLEIMELSDRIKAELTQMIDRTSCFDWFNRKVYRVFNAENGHSTGYLTEYIDHPTVIKSIAIGAKRDDAYDVIGPGSLTVYYKNGELPFITRYKTFKPKRTENQSEEDYEEKQKQQAELAEEAENHAAEVRRQKEERRAKQRAEEKVTNIINNRLKKKRGCPTKRWTPSLY